STSDVFPAPLCDKTATLRMWDISAPFPATLGPLLGGRLGSSPVGGASLPQPKPLPDLGDLRVFASGTGFAGSDPAPFVARAPTRLLLDSGVPLERERKFSSPEGHVPSRAELALALEPTAFSVEAGRVVRQHDTYFDDA